MSEEIRQLPQPTDSQQELANLRKEVRMLSEQIGGLVEAWKTAQGVVRFVRWLSRVASAVAAVWAAYQLLKAGVTK